MTSIPICDKTGRAANGINIVEVLADNEVELEQKLAAVTGALQSQANPNRLGYTIVRDHKDAEAIWTMRKRAVGLLGNVEGAVRPVAFVEDTAVPPQHLAAYIREFRALLDKAGVAYGMFGHVDAGVLHVRPALDLARPDHVPLVREISDAVVALTRKYGGVLWGEHGKGVRSEYVPEFFGDLYPCLQEIKRAFDPENRLNPGKIASPNTTPLLKIDAVPLRGTLDRVIGNEIRAAFDNAAYCNGNGACFDFDETSPMCPSYKASRDRRLSPKGRASLMREWLRLLTEKGVDPRREASNALRTSALQRLLNSLNPKNRQDFSHEIKAVMDSCLSCKACAGQCPVKVSVPSFRAKFLEIYHARYLRPLKDPVISSIETLLPAMARLRPLYNGFVSTEAGRALMRVVGLTALPRLADQSLDDQARKLDVPFADAETLAKLTPEQRKYIVVFVVDTFTAHFEPAVALAAISVARKLGFQPMLARRHVNGKALHVHGYLASFEKAARRTSAYLQSLADLEIPLVGLDPSMTLAFRNEYKMVQGKPLKATIVLPQEWLLTVATQVNPAMASVVGKLILMVHCTERSNAAASVGQWKAVFGALGQELQVADTGCCGMAGTFGHEVKNRAMSEQLYAMSWKPVLDQAESADLLMATGYSCRTQAKAIDGLHLPHPLEMLDRIIR